MFALECIQHATSRPRQTGGSRQHIVCDRYVAMRGQLERLHSDDPIEVVAQQTCGPATCAHLDSFVAGRVGQSIEEHMPALAPAFRDVSTRRVCRAHSFFVSRVEKPDPGGGDHRLFRMEDLWKAHPLSLEPSEVFSASLAENPQVAIV
jgi:hypothetical protein